MNIFKRYGAFLLVLVILVNTTITVFAESPNTYPINLTPKQAVQLAKDREGSPVSRDIKQVFTYKGLYSEASTERLFYVVDVTISWKTGQYSFYYYVDTKTKAILERYSLESRFTRVYDLGEENGKFTTVSGLKQKQYDGTPQTQTLTVKYRDRVLTEGTDYILRYKNNDRIGTGTVEICGLGNFVGKVSKTFNIVEKDMPLPSKAERIYGNSRYETATKIATKLKQKNDNQQFSAIIVATGDNYPDALTGAYLAKVRNAPILITTASRENSIIGYIKKNLKPNGIVFVLGGPNAVPASFSQKLKAGKIRYKRLSGSSRYNTNLTILNETKNLGNELIVVTGNNYPDALSASAVGKPVLLVGKQLTKDQINFIKTKKFSTITIIGGTNAISNGVKNELSKYATVSRVSGSDRYETSAKVASYYFNAGANTIVLAIGNNYPDALTGGPLAAKLNAPMILTNSAAKEYNYAKNFRMNSGATNCIVLGGPKLVTNHAVTEIMNAL